MKKTVIMIFAAVLFSSCAQNDSDTDTEVSVPVSVEELRPASIEQYVTATGTVRSFGEVTIKSEKSGLYDLLTNPGTGRPFALGDRVDKGETVIKLHNEEEQNTIRIDSRKLALETSKLDFEKQKSLYDKGGVTLTEMKNSERTYMDAKYDYDNALIDLSKLKIAPPISGIITDLPYYTRGTTVEAGSEMLQVMDYSRLYLEVNLPGQDLGSIKKDYTVRVMNYNIPDDTLQGTVTQVAPALDPDTRSFKATIIVDNPELLLRPGMFVKAEIIVSHRDSTIVIPKDIILSKQRGKTVFIVEKGAAQERLITTGLENPDQIEVLEGLKFEERLVVKGFETLRNRSKVKVVR